MSVPTFYTSRLLTPCDLDPTALTRLYTPADFASTKRKHDAGVEEGTKRHKVETAACHGAALVVTVVHLDSVLGPRPREDDILPTGLKRCRFEMTFPMSDSAP